jgi:hypothetical protein
LLSVFVLLYRSRSQYLLGKKAEALTAQES